jgi:hypothetical protein
MNVVFENKGIIDLTAIKTFGVSAKENENAIGFFGTGLKYAIAIILRLGGEITIHAGVKTYKFGVSKQKVRGEAFNIITMNRRKLGFTDQVGKTWEPWMAFRELYCNTLDETNGDCFTAGHVEPRPGYTRVVVDCAEIMEAYSKRSEIVLNEPPTAVTAYGELIDRPSSYLYYKGVKVYRLERPSMVTYNITTRLDLTEDRTIKYIYTSMLSIAGIIRSLTDESLISRLLGATKECAEATLDYEVWGFGDISPEFLRVATRLVKEKRTQNTSLINVVVKNSPEPIDLFEPKDLTPVEQKALARAVDFNKRLGFDVDRYPIVTVETLGAGVLGQAKDNTIYLSEKAFLGGTKVIAGTLYEEFIHLSQGVADCERAMQNHLIDTIMTMGETILEEAL